MRLLLFVALALADPNLVQTPSGPVYGYVEEGVRMWKGIPFAAPPIGENRFRPPQPVQPWTQVRNCFENGNICPQLAPIFGEFLGDEDCLYLDVYAPENATAASNLPVMVWIYGGGFALGDNYEFGLYDAINLVNEHGHIHVAMNYRLSSLGFLALEELLSESGTTGNYGAQDQTAALRWVQSSVAAFGGNPKQVTIFGESAGAMSVCWHMASPASAGLFSGAIMESGTCSSPDFFPSLEDAIGFSKEYVQSVGCSLSSDILSCIRGLTTEEILNGGGALAKRSWVAGSPHYTFKYLPRLYPVFPWGCAIDGTSQGLPDLPLNIIQSGKFNKPKALLIGTNENEGSLFIPGLPLIVPGVGFPLDEQGALKGLQHFFNESTAVAALNLYYNSTQSYETMMAFLLRDFFFACPSRRVAIQLASQGINSYLYHFSYLPDWIDDLILGDYHSAELPFVFDNEWPIGVHFFTPDDQEMANIMGKFWTNLAFYLNPNGSGSSTSGPYWEAFSNQTQVDMRLELPPFIEDNYVHGRCLFWDTVNESPHNPTTSTA